MNATFFAETSVLTVLAFVFLLILPLDTPRLRLAYWQSVLTLFFVTPALQWWLLPVLKTNLVYRSTSVAITTLQPRSINWISSLLIAGMLLRTVWLMSGLIRMRQLRLQSHRITKNLFLSPDLTSAVSFGVFRPIILVGPFWYDLEPKIQQAILVHENIHLERKDWLWHLVEEGIKTVLWFCPGVWFVVSRIRLAREESVDTEVVAKTHAKDTYIRALLANVSALPNLPASAFAAQSHLTSRIQSLKKDYFMSKTKVAFTCAALTVCLIGGTASTVLSIPLYAAQSVDPEKVYRAGKDITNPVLLYKTDVAYTPEAKDSGIEGTVILTVHIFPDGTARNVQVIRSLDTGLDAQAVSALQYWKFQPGTKNGEPVIVLATIEVNFRLK